MMRIAKPVVLPASINPFTHRDYERALTEVPRRELALRDSRRFVRTVRIESSQPRLPNIVR